MIITMITMSDRSVFLRPERYVVGDADKSKPMDLSTASTMVNGLSEASLIIYRSRVEQTVEWNRDCVTNPSTIVWRRLRACERRTQCSHITTVIEYVFGKA